MLYVDTHILLPKYTCNHTFSFTQTCVSYIHTINIYAMSALDRMHIECFFRHPNDVCELVDLQNICICTWKHTHVPTYNWKKYTHASNHTHVCALMTYIHIDIYISFNSLRWMHSFLHEPVYNNNNLWVIYLGSRRQRSDRQRIGHRDIQGMSPRKEEWRRWDG